jgi:N-acetylglucosamine-6-phosphate deacetylase
MQINGGFGFDFSVYEGDQTYRDGLKLVAERIVETGVTACVAHIPPSFLAPYSFVDSQLGPHDYRKRLTLLVLPA